MILLTPEEFEKTVAKAVKLGIEQYKAEHEEVMEQAKGKLVILSDLAKQNGYKGIEQYVKIANEKSIELKGRPYRIEARYIPEFPVKKKTA